MLVKIVSLKKIIVLIILPEVWEEEILQFQKKLRRCTRECKCRIVWVVMENHISKQI